MKEIKIILFRNNWSAPGKNIESDFPDQIESVRFWGSLDIFQLNQSKPEHYFDKIYWFSEKKNKQTNTSNRSLRAFLL